MPDWIVRYMVENSLGRLFIDKRKNEGIHADGRGPDEMTWEEIETKRIETEKFIAKQMDWRYYLPEAKQTREVREQIDELQEENNYSDVQNIRCIDPCCGSGHILCYLFDVLMQIYEAYGYASREAVRSIIENNLYGLDIDDRAAQLAYFAVMMKARQYDRRFLSRKYADGEPDVPQPHVYAIRESNRLAPHAVDYFVEDDPKRKQEFGILMEELRDAGEYGSILNITPVDFAALYARVDEVIDDISLHRDTVLTTIWPLIQVAEALAQKYDVVVTNPPYMGSSNASAKMQEYVKKNYPDSKSDLFAVFIERCGVMTAKNRYQAMITQHAWMFLSSFEKLRVKLQMVDTVNMAHLGARAFEEIGGEVVQTTSFVMCKSRVKGYQGTYCRLIEPTTQQGKEGMFLAGENRHTARQDNFSKIPGSPVAYWVSEKGFEAFSAPPFSKRFLSGGRNKTHNNELYVRIWWEIIDHEKWKPYSNGGEYRKWYGNNLDVIDWSETARANYALHGGLLQEKFWSVPAITWNDITSGASSYRIKPIESKYSSVSPTLICEKYDYDYSMLAFLNSSVCAWMNQITNPTLHTLVGNILLLPDKIQDVDVSDMVIPIISLCKADWDSFETSWDFTEHPLVRCKEFSPKEVEEDAKHHITDMNLIDYAFTNWDNECYLRFTQLKANEEELNRIFIDIYGLQDELTPEIEDKDVTVRKADLGRDIRSLISYAVGCMFGRYSLDTEGLVYAGGDWDAIYRRDHLVDEHGNAITFGGVKLAVSKDYTQVNVDGQWVDCTFPVDADNIIPICDDDYFTDDIVGRFVKFIEVVYGKETLEENLRFIADALGGKGQPKDVIRNYFLNDFYADHLKIYQKRPIYWLFASGKKNGFKALIYMHRYQPDTIARMRTDYVHEQQSRYRTAIADLEQRIAGASTGERVKLGKRLKVLQEQAAEIRGYEEKIHHLADQYIAIDLDDGVKVNYAKFQDVLAKIK